MERLKLKNKIKYQYNCINQEKLDFNKSTNLRKNYAFKMKLLKEMAKNG